MYLSELPYAAAMREQTGAPPASPAPNLVIEPEDIDPSLFFAPTPEGGTEYRLGPEDVLEITVFEMDQFNRSVRVSGDGSIDLPLLGSIRVGGLTPEEASARVAARLKDDYVQNPQVGIFVKEFNSRRLSLLGAVDRPATYPMLGSRSLLQLLSDAGGITEDADQFLFVFRQSEDGRRARLTVPLDELLVAGDPSWDIWLQPGDVISVPPREFIEVSVLGAVERPGNYEVPKREATLLKALARAQWLNRQGSKKGIEIHRVVDGKQVILAVNLKDVLAGKAKDVPLIDGDVVFVDERFF